MRRYVGSHKHNDKNPHARAPPAGRAHKPDEILGGLIFVGDGRGYLRIRIQNLKIISIFIFHSLYSSKGHLSFIFIIFIFDVTFSGLAQRERYC